MPEHPWRAVDRMFRATLQSPTTVGQLLAERADLIWRKCLASDPAVTVFFGGDDKPTPTEDEARARIAREYGFADWGTVLEAGDQPVDVDFEKALDAIVSGDEEGLRALLDVRPDLAYARSAFGHRATLVHYVSANGVEAARQWQTPLNAVPLLRMLLEYGADPDATCDTYRGGNAQTPLCLLVSSVHPADAGVQGDLVTELCRGGAKPNGLDDDGLPLWTAVTFGYREAAEALARCGARVDNLVFAAAVGDASSIHRYLEQDAPEVRIGVDGPVLDPRNMTGYALIYAAGLGRADVVQLLLTQQPDLSLTEPIFGATALGAARYHGYADVEALLSGG